MEVITLKAANLLSSMTSIQRQNPNPKFPSIRPHFLASNTSKVVPFPRKSSLLPLPHCYTKPDTNANSDTDPNCTFQTEHTPDQTKPPSKDSTLSSIFPSPASSGGLVLGLGPTGSWDSREIGSPVVKRFLHDEEERWYMWYHGSCDGGYQDDPTTGNVPDSIGLAVSSNGVHWERGMGPVVSSGDAGLVMKCSADWWAFDTLSIRPSDVVVMSSDKVRAPSAVYWLYYTGFWPEEVEGFDKYGSFESSSRGNPERFCLYDAGSDNGGNKARIFKSLPGLAISQDGRHWARIEGEHHSGALFDLGSEGEWDSLFVASPQVVVHGNGDLRMYYHSFDARNEEFGIGVSRSRDGIKWVKLGKVIGGGKSGCFDELGAMNACVVKQKRDGKLKYLMVYEGVDADGKRGIGLAVSSDGLKDWRRVRDEAVLEPSRGEGWDNKGVGSPCLVQMDGEVDEWRLYYTGIGDRGRTGIGMAISRGEDFTCFRRWTGFQL